MQQVEIPSKHVGPPPIHRPNQKGVKGKGRKGEKKKRKEEPKREEPKRQRENPTTETHVCEPQRKR